MDLSKIVSLKINNPAKAEELFLVENELGLVLPKVMLLSGMTAAEKYFF